MAIKKGSNTAELTLSKVLIVALVLTVLMAIFILYFFKQEQQIEQAGLRTVVSNFTSKLLVVRSQWLMTGKPPVVVVKSKDSKGLSESRLTVNKQGWIDVRKPNHVNVCEQIWKMVMDNPLAFFNMPIGTVLLNKNNKVTIGHGCRYTVKNGDYFEYHSANGHVSKVKRDH